VFFWYSSNKKAISPKNNNSNNSKNMECMANDSRLFLFAFFPVESTMITTSALGTSFANGRRWDERVVLFGG